MTNSWRRLSPPFIRFASDLNVFLLSNAWSCIGSSLSCWPEAVATSWPDLFQKPFFLEFHLLKELGLGARQKFMTGYLPFPSCKEFCISDPKWKFKLQKISGTPGGRAGSEVSRSWRKQKMCLCNGLWQSCLVGPQKHRHKNTTTPTQKHHQSTKKKWHLRSCTFLNLVTN